MKLLRAKDLRNLTMEELLDKNRSLQEELFHLRYQAKAGKIEKPSRIRELRRDIARVKTVIRELRK
jgi:large subunit ribosomal protein L29